MNTSNPDLAMPGKMSPNNIEAEEAVLGSILINPDALFDVATFLKADDFFLVKNGWVWEAILEVHEQREPIDFLTITSELESKGRLQEIGGPVYISRLMDVVPSAIHAEAYGRIVEQAALRRRLLGAASKVAQLAYNEAENIEVVLDKAEQELFGVSEQRLTRDLQPIKTIVNQYYDRIRELSERDDALLGVPTGFKMLDKLLGGLQRSDLAIIAGRPGMGKCISADAQLVDTRTGDVIAIRELIRRRQANILTLTDNYKLRPAEAAAFLDDGLKPVYRVQTALGREIKVTLSHPFLTTSGWRPLVELSVGDLIAVPGVIPVFGKDDPPEDQVRALALLLAGEDKSAAEKDIPGSAYRYTQRKLALFLNRLFAGDGSVYIQPDNQAVISYRTVSPKLARAVQHLLLRFGIIANLRHQPSCELRITGTSNLLLFINEIGAFGKEQPIAKVRAYAQEASADPGDVYWDRIVSIEPLGEQQVYDLTVPGTHNFVANDMIVHNTGFLLGLSLHAARQYRKRAAIFSLEMSAEQVVGRLVAAETGIDSQRLRRGALRRDEWPIFTEAIGRLGELQIYIDDTPSITPLQLRTKCRRLYAEHGLDLIVLDYLQLMSGDFRSDNRVQEISYISRHLKGLARELNVPVLAAAQLSRAVEQRQDKHPMLSDLRESGSIEQDSDVVMFIYRDEYYNKEETEKPNIAEIAIAKHRNGPTGTVDLFFKKELAQFRDLETRQFNQRP